MARRTGVIVLVALFLFSPAARAQQPIDLFSDVPALGDGAIRIGAWNLRHINVEGDADDFLPGATEAEDFAILTATFAKAVRDLGLDVVAISEHQPRTGEPNRLHQIRDHLNGAGAGPWRAHESAIPYDGPVSPFGGLQLAMLWNSNRVTIDPADAELLGELRQPRNANGILTERTLRAPWLVPIQAGNLSCDLIIVHLKSGGASPQAAEVAALEQFLRTRLTQPSPAHTVLLGDWNIRPDQASGRGRLEQLRVPDGGAHLMRVLTVEEIPPSLSVWEALGSIDAAEAAVVPFTHVNENTLDTFLDHVAISRTLDSAFSHPVQVPLASGVTDLGPGIRIAVPLLPESDYHQLTDHLPVVLTLRTAAVTAPPPGPQPTGLLRIVAARPNPDGDDIQLEEVHILNETQGPASLSGWRVEDSTGAGWVLNAGDGTLSIGATAVVVRQGRPMSLDNLDGDVIVLRSPQGTEAHRVEYSGQVSSGELVQF